MPLLPGASRTRKCGYDPLNSRVKHKQTVLVVATGSSGGLSSAKPSPVLVEHETECFPTTLLGFESLRVPRSPGLSLLRLVGRSRRLYGKNHVGRDGGRCVLVEIRGAAADAQQMRCMLLHSVSVQASPCAAPPARWALEYPQASDANSLPVKVTKGLGKRRKGGVGERGRKSGAVVMDGAVGFVPGCGLPGTRKTSGRVCPVGGRNGDHAVFVRRGRVGVGSCGGGATRQWVKMMSSGQVRARQHVNPLARSLQERIVLQRTWPESVFEDCERPLWVDIGVAKGRFVLEMAERHPDRNFLGLEIREQLVEQANGWRDEQELRNLDFLFCNANVSLEPILSRFRKGTVDCVSIQFPDPWFKKRHQKRRVVQTELVETIAEHLSPGGQLYVVSDVLEVAEEMVSVIGENLNFADSGDTEWLRSNPFDVLTEREKACQNKGRPVFAKLYTRTSSD